jgi:pimeloyl-ACP methyl ester carboxylesterase
VGEEQEDEWFAGSEAFGTACSTYGTPLSGSMSTAQVARDMDVLRRMLGDEQLTYLGRSYGSYLGTVYANLFPERVRAVSIDGVFDPTAWAGTPQTAHVPQTARIRSGEAADTALREILDRCGEAGAEYCALAAHGDPIEVYEQISARLKEGPISMTGEESDETDLLDYPNLIHMLLVLMFDPTLPGYALVDATLTEVHRLIEEETGGGDVDHEDADAARAALRDLAERSASAEERTRTTGSWFGSTYDNYSDAFQTVLCTDGRNPARAEQWPSLAAAADERAPGFGSYWTWASSPCAEETWTVRDEDAYYGPFTARTANPVLVVGNYWDPSTPYEGAVAAARLLPESRLLSSDSWGHTAYGTSECVTDAVDAYLITGTLPAEGTVCVGDIQPFTTPLAEEGEPGSPEEPSGPGAGARSVGPKTAEGSDLPERLPPVVPPLPGAVPRL